MAGSLLLQTHITSEMAWVELTSRSDEVDIRRTNSMGRNIVDSPTTSSFCLGQFDQGSGVQVAAVMYTLQVDFPAQVATDHSDVAIKVECRLPIDRTLGHADTIRSAVRVTAKGKGKGKGTIFHGDAGSDADMGSVA